MIVVWIMKAMECPNESMESFCFIVALLASIDWTTRLVIFAISLCHRNAEMTRLVFEFFSAHSIDGGCSVG